MPSPGVHRHAVPLPRAEELAAQGIVESAEHGILLLWTSLVAPLLTLRLPHTPINPTPVPLRAPAHLAGAQSRTFHLWNPSVADCRAAVIQDIFIFTLISSWENQPKLFTARYTIVWA